MSCGVAFRYDAQQEPPPLLPSSTIMRLWVVILLSMSLVLPGLPLAGATAGSVWLVSSQARQTMNPESSWFAGHVVGKQGRADQTPPPCPLCGEHCPCARPTTPGPARDPAPRAPSPSGLSDVWLALARALGCPIERSITWGETVRVVVSIDRAEVVGGWASGMSLSQRLSLTNVRTT